MNEKQNGDNAFNEANRLIGLAQVAQLQPGLLPHLRGMYLGTAKGWYFGLPDGIQSIDSEAGVSQGDVLASWGYNITIHPLLLELQQIVDEEFLGEGSIMFYVDDGNLIAPHHVMLRLLDAGPTYGYKIKKNKGHYCIGHCDTMAEAQERWNNLRDLGFQEDIISLHPDNVEDQSPEGHLRVRRSTGSRSSVPSWVTLSSSELSCKSISTTFAR